MILAAQAAHARNSNAHGLHDNNSANGQHTLNAHAPEGLHTGSVLHSPMAGGCASLGLAHAECPLAVGAGQFHMSVAHQASQFRSRLSIKSDPKENHALAGITLEDLTRTPVRSPRSSTLKCASPNHNRTGPWSFTEIWATHKQVIHTRPAECSSSPACTSRQ
ncbi:Uncharacterized protein TCM_040559 [Theobroma cacao]|uniref:Uncharacterized protein n=1 Tax=Theobroma cacao TaxID=3641 RepID=A0A061GSS6_THECC|nr:Uncharacterized protein TCM_040559 [Theobroma cacao]